jgi:hypothetical protein
MRGALRVAMAASLRRPTLRMRPSSVPAAFWTCAYRAHNRCPHADAGV